MLRCLEKDPAKRFADVSSLEQALAACGCAGQWDEERAAGWWQDHAGTATNGAAADGLMRANGGPV
jgi:hypothetical protein